MEIERSEVSLKHPTEVQLVTWMDSGNPPNEVAAHVGQCFVCLELTSHSVPDWEVTPPTGAQAWSTQSTFVAPKDDQPARGQVWRLRWNSTSLLGLLWNIEQDHVTFLPVTVDTNMADDRTVVFSASETAGFGPAAVWLGLECPVSWFVLDVCWGSLPTGPVDAVRSRIKLGKPLDLVGVTMGASVADVFDDRLEYRALLDETVNEFRAACWVPVNAETTLLGLTANAGVNLDTVVATLGAPPTERLRFKRGLRPLDQRDAEKLSGLLKVDPELILSTNPKIPSNLECALNRPRWRADVCAFALDNDLDEIDARLRTSYAVIGLAARQSNSEDSEEQWHERLKHHFAS